MNATPDLDYSLEITPTPNQGIKATDDDSQ